MVVNCSLIGRYIRVQRSDGTNGPITLCEVEVYVADEGKYLTALSELGTCTRVYIISAYLIQSWHS